jgi:Carboxypeptidase regulatory-like domain
MRMLYLILIVAANGLLSVTPLYSQSEATMWARFERAVRSENGSALPDALVTIVNQDNGVQRRVQTDAFGRYSASSLPLGNYGVTAEYAGFVTTRQNGFVTHKDSVFRRIRQ